MNPEDENKILERLSRFRAKLWDLRVIGKNSTDSYGNVSHRLDEESFAISRSGVGGLRKLSAEDFCVVDYKQGEFPTSGTIIRGFVTSEWKPSRDLQIHKAFYCFSRKINVVVHFHHPLIWSLFQDRFPTTRVDLPPSSLELAKEIYDLCHKLDFDKEWMIVLGSHEDGIVSFAESIESLEEKLIPFLKEYPLQSRKK